jgi:formyltetrahydrofolate-dependent phosphoribosylglycinamide formyltransferase
MFKKLQRKWKVNGISVLLILTTFALGGSVCGIVGRKIMELTGMEKGVTWVILYIIILTIIWPLCVLIVSIPLGQFSFFKKYINKIFNRFSGSSNNINHQPVNDGQDSSPGSKKLSSAQLINKEQSLQPVMDDAGQKNIIRIAIFASGTGSNAKKIIEYFKNNDLVKIVLVVCNNPQAGVLQIAKTAGIDSLLIEKERFFKEDGYVPELTKYHIDQIILAGFLWKIPSPLLKAWPASIINIHPALLPKYGGKGMYGLHVHEAVIANKDKESGISIHYVDDVYDNGEIIRQVSCPVSDTDTPESLALKIHELEHEHYSRVIEEVIKAKKALNKTAVNHF